MNITPSHSFKIFKILGAPIIIAQPKQLLQHPQVTVLVTLLEVLVIELLLLVS